MARYFYGDRSFTGQNDIIGGTNSSFTIDYIYGLGGNDRLFGYAGTDYIYGGSGSDVISGGLGNDGLYGQTGDDDIWGGDGSDFINGGTGWDYLDGGAGNDVIFDEGIIGGALAVGGTRDDIFGGSGNDRFILSIDRGVGGSFTASRDYIDGGSGTDVIDLGQRTVNGSMFARDLANTSWDLLFWEGVNGAWQYDYVRNVEFVRDADGLNVVFDDLFV
jgi:Ca2+-binding RTX toxin-like protein